MSTEIPEPETEETVFGDDDGVLYDDEVTPEYGILGFTLRELLIVGVWLVSFVLSFFPLSGGLPLWGIGIQWLLPIGLPTVAVFLLVLRRFSPDGIRRVGSLGIDQFASVAFAVSACVWVGTLWLAVSAALSTGRWGLPWNGVILVIASLALVVLTVFAPLVPGLKEDFHGRLVTLAHRNANPVRPVIARPRPEAAGEPDATIGSGTRETEPEDVTAVIVAAQPVPAESAPAESLAAEPEPVDGGSAPAGHQATDEIQRLDLAEQVPLSAHASGGDTGTVPTADDEYVPAYSRRSRGQEPEILSDTGSIESLLGATAVDPEDPAAIEPERVESGIDVDATNPRQEAAPATQPFWILAPTERDVHDERGEPLFRIGPSAWALVIEDRGGAYVVRHDDGRIGYLHEITDITKG